MAYGTNMCSVSKPLAETPGTQRRLSRRRYIRGMRRVTLWLGAICLAAIAVTVLVLIDQDETASAVGWIVAGVSVVMVFAPLLAKHYDPVALWWARLRRRESLPWNLSVQLRGDFSSPDFFERVEQEVQRTLPGRVHVVMPRAINGIRLAVDGVGLVEMMLDDTSEVEATSLVIHFTGLRIAPYEAVRRLEQEVLPTVRAVEAAVEGVPREQSWVLAVMLDEDRNPFLPLYLRDRDPAELDVFRVSYKRPGSQGDRIDLGKGGINLYASTSDGFLSLVRDFVTFSGAGVSAPRARA